MASRFDKKDFPIKDTVSIPPSMGQKVIYLSKDVPFEDGDKVDIFPAGMARVRYPDEQLVHGGKQQLRKLIKEILQEDSLGDTR